MNNFGVRHYKVTKVKLITIIMNIIKKNQFIILLTIMSLFSITSLSTTLCYKVKLDNYNKDNINEKTYIKTDSNIKYYYSNNNNINISKDIAASNLVNCIENQLNLESLNDTIKSTINNLQNLYNEKDEYFSFIYKDIYTGYTVSYNADSPIFTASSIKAPAMIYLYEKASTGEIDLNENYYTMAIFILKEVEY